MSETVSDLMINAVGLSKEYDLKTHKVMALRDATFRSGAANRSPSRGRPAPARPLC